VTTTSARAEQIATFYAQHAVALQRTVARRAHAPEQTIEDACQNAWATLLRHSDVTLDQRGLAWLATVAAREAWRLASRAREIPAGAYLAGDPEPGILAEPPGNTTDPADQAAAREQHAQCVEDFARLQPREREALYLKALGHSCQEIAALTNASYMAVNRRINEGRARLRKLARERDTPTDDGGEEGGEDPPRGA
jgi:RNA polymerase sigma factor (sigma-70 family)